MPRAKRRDALAKTDKHLFRLHQLNHRQNTNCKQKYFKTHPSFINCSTVYVFRGTDDVRHTW
jgi:hypothetical protein